LIHVVGFDLSLVFRKLLGAGMPQEWSNPGSDAIPKGRTPGFAGVAVAV